MKQHKGMMIFAEIVALLLLLSIIGIPIAVMIMLQVSQLEALIEIGEKK